jgi:hypothetical protein
MRVMEIPRFPREIQILELDYFVRARLGQTIVAWPEQSIPLLGYMCYPNDAEARDPLLVMLRNWQKGIEDRPPILRKLGRIQHEWSRVADIFHTYCDLISGDHQEKRGGPSIGKAITLVEANTKSGGTGAANLWKMWSTYKDVAHLVTAAALVFAEARIVAVRKPFGPFGLSADQFGHLTMAMFMPDLVIAAALSFEHLGLSFVPYGLEKPTLAPETLWRIPPNINVVPIPPLVRKIRPQDLLVLRERRAGNRGKGKEPAAATQTTFAESVSAFASN